MWSLLGNIVWIIVFGWELVLVHLVAGLLLCLTVVGIPLGIACWKMVPLALLPLGSKVVPIDSVPRAQYGVPLGAAAHGERLPRIGGGNRLARSRDSMS